MPGYYNKATSACGNVEKVAPINSDSPKITSSLKTFKIDISRTKASFKNAFDKICALNMKNKRAKFGGPSYNSFRDICVTDRQNDRQNDRQKNHRMTDNADYIRSLRGSEGTNNDC